MRAGTKSPQAPRISDTSVQIAKVRRSVGVGQSFQHFKHARTFCLRVL